MNVLRKHRALLLGASLIILTNAIALAGAAYNRSGAPESTLLLSERELVNNNYDYDDNSGVAVSFQWNVLSKETLDTPKLSSYAWNDYSHEAYWLNDAKLKQLGFDITDPVFPAEGSYRYKQLKDREVFLVLEQDGPSYQRYLAHAKANAKVASNKADAIRQVRVAEYESSRLFVIDAGTHAETLRTRYPNRNTYAIVKGIVSANWQSTNTKPALNAYIGSLSVSSLHVSKPYDTVFIGNTKKYRVNVAFGQRYEPWIVGARKQ
ncbi:MAG: DUF4824 family protein [Arenimonas sp.]